MKQVLSGCLAFGVVMALCTATQAAPLNKGFAGEPFLDTGLSGTTSALRPELAGTVLEDVIQEFSLLNIKGNVQSRVVREDGTGTLDFSWRVWVLPSSTGGNVSTFRLKDFGYDHISDADFRTDGVGSVAPYLARVFNPATHPTGAINFGFTDPAIGPGDPNDIQNGSYFFFLRTTALDYSKTALYDLLGGPSDAPTDTFTTFAPIPEPSSALLGSSALFVASLARRRRIS